MAAGLQGMVQRADRAARKRSQRTTTAHLVLTTYDSPQAGALLARHGVDEASLIEALGVEYDETYNAVAAAVERARSLAAALGEAMATPAHLLLAILREPRSAGWQCLLRAGTDPLRIRDEADAVLRGRAAPSSAGLALPAPAEVSAGIGVTRGQRAPRVRDARLHSRQHLLARETESKRSRARQERHEPVSEAAPGMDAPRDLPAAGGRSASGVQPIALPIAKGAPLRAVRPKRPAAPSRGKRPTAGALFLDPARFPVLTSIGRNLSLAAAEGLIDPVIGRGHEIEQLLDVLARRRANNPILVGPSGVGKTAVVEGLALALLDERGGGAGRVLVEISAGSLVSGTGVRGALSERVQALRAEIAAGEGRIVLFIDEVHALVGLDDGADGVAGELKAALARGEFACIGATTDAEYRRVFERDLALARRFTRVDVGEPAPAAAVEILRGIAPQYERHHGVTYDEAALQAAVEMSVRFLSERQLPDKAIALVDQAAARVGRRGGTEVGVEAIAQVVSEQSGVPVDRLLMTDGEAMMALEAHLSERLVGQEDAVAAIADALRKSAAGFRGARPLGTFLFLGPTGVGKTEMAKAIHALLFPGAEMTRIDMSELSEAHAVARLVGAPPGYVGHHEGGQLTEAVRGRPYQLVLLDEAEKAHPDVLVSLLPLLDEGRLTDGRGRTVDFTNTVVVMTSNLGTDASEPRGRIGFGADSAAERRQAMRERALGAARAALPPELWNRIDEPLYFQPLDRDTVARIAERMVREVVEVVRARHAIEIEIDASVCDALVAAGGFDPALGARPMRRTVGRLIEARLAQAILSSEIGRGDRVLLRGEHDRIALERAPTRSMDAAE